MNVLHFYENTVYMKKETDRLNALIYMSCELMNILPPLIYYVSEDSDDTILYDQHLNIISYDIRDIGYHVIHVLFVDKEKTIYIHLSMLNELMKAYILILRETRRMYQLEEIRKYLGSKETHEDIELIKTWLYSYQTYHANHTYNLIAPTEQDCNAYASYLFKIILKIRLRFEVKYDEAEELKKFNEKLIKLSSQYYQNKIIELSNKYKFS